jgi:beta-N-acetylhexosaminidase
MVGLIREHLGFPGVIVTDALDMGAFGTHHPDAPLGAGADLLLYGPAQAGDLPEIPARASERLEVICDWLMSFDDPGLDVLGCRDHRDLATELAQRSITLVRDDAGLLPLRPSADTRILAVMPHPKNLTPADTSEAVKPLLAESLRRMHRSTTEYLVDFDPDDDEVAEAVRMATQHDLVVVGTLDASPGQSALVRRVLATGTPTVTVAMRTPYDLASYPESSTHLCTYGILEPSVDALVAALFGERIMGRLPVAVPNLYPVGHGIQTQGAS